MTPSKVPSSQPAPDPAIGSWALIVDDHPLFCDALELTLKSIADFNIVRTSNCLEAALKELDALPAPDLILLDLNLPDVSGLDGLLQLKRRAETAQIIVVSSMADNAVVHSAIAAGASGFVPKHSARTTFKDALDAIRAGSVYKPTGYVEGEEITQEAQNIARLSSLTNQQARILQAICEGKLNKQIAYDLSIAETTVKAHVTAIMRKLGVQSRTQAVLVAHESKFTNLLPKDE
ncbi:response regulator transcription factor [Sulfitobacter albidus]|uniref:Response regulator transcription factor n=1 Tax=Sulfitobacter albidus TaxID=2829501 RepID=A0A975JE36_9RHOB|nr:response regulator transcription factor [Sulfitobacter albidus]QUJ76763.1 response regulator transcription factor [Sulfitobacter albidus]